MRGMKVVRLGGETDREGYVCSLHDNSLKFWSSTRLKNHYSEREMRSRLYGIARTGALYNACNWRHRSAYLTMERDHLILDCNITQRSPHG